MIYGRGGPRDNPARPPDDDDPRPWPECPNCFSRERGYNRGEQFCCYCRTYFTEDGVIFVKNDWYEKQRPWASPPHAEDQTLNLALRLFLVIHEERTRRAIMKRARSDRKYLAAASDLVDVARRAIIGLQEMAVEAP